MGSKPVVFIVGPTASGKSDVAMQLARAHNGEIICADSRTIYRGMDILTAKPSAEDQRQITHWCLDLVNPGERWTVRDWQQVAKNAIADIHDRGKLPIIVGGTGLYVESLLYDFSFYSEQDDGGLDDVSTEELRKWAEAEFGEGAINKSTAANRRYLIRALRTHRLPHSTQDRTLGANVVLVGINPGREVLRARITSRVDDMVRLGLVEEVTQLSRQQIGGEAATAIAYKPIVEYLEGAIDLTEAKRLFVQGDLRLAKKQMTWFRRDHNIAWFDTGSEALVYLEQKLALF